MKTCKKCGVEYPANTEYFHVHAVKNYRGLHPYCKKCRKVARHKYYKEVGK